MDLPMVKLIKLDKMAVVMHEADHAYSIQSTWWLDRLATDVLFNSLTLYFYLLLVFVEFYFMIWIVVF